MINFEQIEQQALNLSKEERFDLIVHLLESIDSAGNEKQIMEKWVQEAGRRYERWKNGKEETLSFKKVDKKIKNRLQR